MERGMTMQPTNEWNGKGHRQAEGKIKEGMRQRKV
jgi:hypothetical protein